VLPHTRAPRRPLPQAEQAPDAGHDRLWWARIRLTAADVALIVRALSHPATKPQLATLWQAFLLEQAETKAALEQADWSQVPDDDLVAYGEGRAAVLSGIASFLPRTREYADVPFAVKCSLYVHLLVLFGIGAVAAGAPVSPLFLALEAVRLHQGGQYAIREMSRRGSKHVGVHMALLLLAARNDTHETVVAEALEALRKAMHRQLSQGTRDVIGRATYTGRTTPGAAMRSEMDVQSFETGHQRWGHLDWRTLLTRGFGGGLDIAPRAIADDLKDLARGLRRLPIPVPFGNVLSEEPQAEARLMVEKLNDAAEDLARREAEVFPERLLMDQLKAAADLSPREAEVFEIVRAVGADHGAIKAAAERLEIKEGNARVIWSRTMKKLIATARRLQVTDR
jgi:hypothetical protein